MMQQIYFVVGVAGIALGAALAIATIVFFFVADIRGVLADLSGKARQADIKEREERRRSRRAKKALTSDQEWQGDIVEGELKGSVFAAGEGADASSDPSDDDEDEATTGKPSAGGSSELSSDALRDTICLSKEGAFVVARSAVVAHSPNVIDGNGNEVAAS